jgi:hypothetical protein
MLADVPIRQNVSKAKFINASPPVVVDKVRPAVRPVNDVINNINTNAVFFIVYYLRIK